MSTAPEYGLPATSHWAIADLLYLARTLWVDDPACLQAEIEPLPHSRRVGGQVVSLRADAPPPAPEHAHLPRVNARFMLIGTRHGNWPEESFHGFLAELMNEVLRQHPPRFHALDDVNDEPARESFTVFARGATESRRTEARERLRGFFSNEVLEAVEHGKVPAAAQRSAA